ncbi:MAG: oligosaccharide flippase family protein [Bacteroidia bacterium]|nr:oligosaccharide flippase family protein [Bacteroidia bacterium]
MKNPIKELAGQTMIYGFGTIVPRLLNFLLLTPFYTRIFAREEFGIFSELYSYSAILLVILTYGMETAYFRFTGTEQNHSKVYGTALISLLSTSFLFLVLLFLFSSPLSHLIHYEHNPEYIIYFSIIISSDAFTSIIFAKLRYENKPLKFAVIKLLNIFTIIFLVFFFLWYCPAKIKSNPDSVLSLIYSEKIGVGYAFIANVAGSLLEIALLFHEIIRTQLGFSFKLLMKMLSYSWPLIIVGLGGQINENIDKILLKYLLPGGSNNLEQVGIYSAAYKIAVFMTLFNQMFRYAADPFFFSHAKDKDSKSLYADVMKYFIIFGLLIFLCIMLFIDFVKYFIGENFHEGLFIVPIVLAANLFFGILINLSIWYKLKNLTVYGAYLSIFGALITLIINIIFIPIFGYAASAWATFLCYFSMTLLSYFWCMKFFPIHYDLKSIFFYFAIAAIFYIFSIFLNNYFQPFNLILNVLFILLFIYIAFTREKIKIIQK